MTRPRRKALIAALALLALLVAAGCHHPQREDAGPTGAAAAREGVADAKTPGAVPPVAGGPQVATPGAVPPAAGGPQAANEEGSPRRPARVPAQAFWVGGPDGGVFLVLERSNARKGTFAAKIYHPDGELWYAGSLVLKPPGTSVDPSQHGQFVGWDGERLLMNDGRWLEPVRK